MKNQVNYSAAFLSAIQEAPMVRSIRKNQNSDKDQYTVQVMQEISTAAPGANSVLNIAQGGNGGQRITALISVAGKQLEKCGIPLEDAYYCEDEVTLSASEVFSGYEMAISVTENTTKNPNWPSQEPKMNPSTQEVVTSNGKPIYRHTELVLKGDEERVFLQSDSSKETRVATEETSHARQAATA